MFKVILGDLKTHKYIGDKELGETFLVGIMTLSE